MGGAGPAYMRELSLLQRNTAAGAFTAHPVSDVVVRHLPGMSEDAVAEASADATGAEHTRPAGADTARQQQS